MSALRWIGASVLALAFGCASIVGIEDAELDPELADGGDATGGAGGAGATLCSRYCDAALTNCQDHPVYFSRAVCETSCGFLDPGDESDETGNTVACRLRSAELALTIGELDVQCPAAGPGGDGRCGTNCEGYCTLMRGACPELFETTFTDESGCLEACALVPDEGGFVLNNQTGDSLNCRLYHVTAAALDPMFHCPHAAGLNTCTP